MKKMNLNASALKGAFKILNTSVITEADFKKSAPWVKVLSLAFIAAVLIAGGYYLTTAKIGPLMLTLAITVPVLCIGIGEQDKTIQRIGKEWGEYQNATNVLIELLATLDLDENTRIQLESAIDQVNFESNGLTEVLGDVNENLRRLAQEAIQVAVDTAKQVESSVDSTSESGVQTNIIMKDEREDLGVHI